MIMKMSKLILIFVKSYLCPQFIPKLMLILRNESLKVYIYLVDIILYEIK